MDLENLKRWHWVVIGLFLGAVLAVWRGFWGPSLEGMRLIRPENTQLAYAEIEGARHTIIRQEKFEDVPVYFEYDILNPRGGWMPYFRGLTILPSKPGDPAGQSVVKGFIYQTTRKDREHSHAQEFAYFTSTPFLPRPNYLIDPLPKVGDVNVVADPNYDSSKAESYKKYRDIEDQIWKIRKNQADIRKGKGAPGELNSLEDQVKDLTKQLAQPDAKLTIGYYLDQLKAKYPTAKLSYSYAWWILPWANWTLFMGGMTILVGGIWPTVLGLLLGAGWGRAPEAKERRIKLTKSTSKSPVRGQTGLTDKDMARVVAMGNELEKKLTQEGVLGQAAVTNVATEAETAKAGAPAVKLATDLPPLQPATAVAQTPKDDKEFGATEKDYYPTEVHAPASESKRDEE